MEKLIFNHILIFIENELITTYRPRFKPGNCCINKLLSITHGIYKTFDKGYGVRGLFVDILESFHKTWHSGISFKLKR